MSAFWNGWVSGTRRAYGIGLLFSAGAAMPDRLPWWVPLSVACCYALTVAVEKRVKAAGATP
jgi:hypothetical protein